MAKTENPTKVQPNVNADSTDAPQKERRKRKKKPVFDRATAVDAEGKAIELTEENELTAVPSNWTDESARLKKEDFVEEALWYEWKATLIDTKIEALRERQNDLNLKAKELREGLSPVEEATRKREKLLKELEKINGILASEGAEVE